jgi:tetratricopeptide (TPR) repeat protein
VVRAKRQIGRQWVLRPATACAAAAAVAAALLAGGCGGDWRANLDSGMTLMREGQFEAAVPRLEKAARANPGSATAQANLGMAYSEVGNVSGAVAALKRAADLSPEDAQPYELLGLLFLRLDRLDEARRNLDDAQKRAPDSARLMTARAVVDIRAGDPATAQQRLARALGMQPDYPAALYNMAYVCRLQPSGAAAAAAYYNRFLKTSLQEDRHAEGARAYVKSLGGASEEDAARIAPLLASARAAVKAQDYAQALITLKEGVRSFPASPDVLWDLVVLYRDQLDDADTTRDLVVQFRTRFPSDRRSAEAAALLAALAPSRQGPGLQGILGSAGADPARAAELYQRGATQHAAGQWAAAAELYRQALSHDRNLVAAALNLGLVFSVQGDAQGASEAFEYVLKLDPGNAEAGYNLALAWRARGQPAKAEECVRKVIEAHPDHARSYHLMGLLYYSAGRTGEARNYFNRFIALAPADPVARQTREWLAMQP